LPRIEPVIEALTSSSLPCERATIEMISSAALPNVALRRPPTLGPVWMASSSVASPRKPARGTSPRQQTTNRARSFFRKGTNSRAKAIGTKTIR
jgi:hypothetical protein